MLPIGPLMIEHRLIERLIALMQRELTRMKDNIAVDREFAFVDPVFIDTAVDFMKPTPTAATTSRKKNPVCRVGQKRPDAGTPSDDGGAPRRSRLGPETTASLVEAKNDFILDKAGALDDLLLHLEELVVFIRGTLRRKIRNFFCRAWSISARPNRRNCWSRWRISTKK